jgi:hypothetical protein
MNVSNHIQEWIEKADHDLGSAKIIYLHIPEYSDVVAFHCQQAVEKYLKAALIYFDINFERTHNLSYLLDLLSRKVAVDSKIYDESIKLNSFAVQIRYPNIKIELTKSQLEEAINTAEEMRKIAEKIISNS